jgi:hypothetical protein
LQRGSNVFARAALLFAALGVTVACTPFSSDSGTAGSSDGGAPEGALLDASGPEASTADAATFDAGRPCSAPACEDFESTAWATTWLGGTASNAPTVTRGSSTSGSRALDVAITGSTTSYVFHGAAPATKLTLTANVLVDKMGDGEVDLLGIGESANPGSQGLYLVHPVAAGQALAVEIEGVAQTSLGADFSAFTAVKLEVDLDAGVYAYTIGGGGGRVEGKLPNALLKTSVTFFVGITFATGVTKPWHIRYDDVAITAQ